MSENKRYYWLKLKEDFFEDDTIQWIEEQENGKEYSLFYLKLCLKSLSMDGKVARIVGNNLMPYDKKALSKATNTDVDTVVVALELFKAIGLVEIFDSGEIYMKQIDEMVGSETDEARKKRRQRANLAGTKTLLNVPEGQQGDNVPAMSDESPPEYRVKSLDSKVTTTTTPEPILQFLESNLMVRLSPIQIEKLFTYSDDFNGQEEILRKAVEIAADKNKRYFGYVDMLLQEWFKNKCSSLEAVLKYEKEKFGKKPFANIPAGSSTGSRLSQFRK